LLGVVFCYKPPIASSRAIFIQDDSKFQNKTNGIILFHLLQLDKKYLAKRKSQFLLVPAILPFHASISAISAI
jgi:hypothetical protein